ncbi:MAG: hypothetical protein E7358_01305 [Clostridiales bacterium]|jgi:hypothetical protein|nr:hypothetical protein [Clostridiales bacterium]
MKKFIKALTTCVVLLLTMVLFVACVPNNAESATKKMKEEGYSVISAPINAEGIVEGILATDIEGFEMESLTAVWFETVEDAKKFMENFEEDENELIKRNGKCVYFGTADAIEDFED